MDTSSDKQQVCIQEDLEMAKKSNFKGETEFLLIAMQNNAIMTNYIQVKIDKTQQNSKCRLYEEIFCNIVCRVVLLVDNYCLYIKSSREFLSKNSFEYRIKF